MFPFIAQAAATSAQVLRAGMVVPLRYKRRLWTGGGGQKCAQWMSPPAPWVPHTRTCLGSGTFRSVLSFADRQPHEGPAF